ncbi:hypothetical protein CH341_24580 [Rhodoplanes roseus]|uniref:Uncharacterized protein n=1 Tax=Rhodoplanes roseus TaxID=29409 RepID=A0A327KNX9_9BRAD|nr:hypothetical protein CH341_24580 [Rhodoplanes roseus]
MPRAAAHFTQADVARVIRAAMQAGAGAVEVRRDGTMLILLSGPALAPSQAPTIDDDDCAKF